MAARLAMDREREVHGNYFRYWDCVMRSVVPDHAVLVATAGGYTYVCLNGAAVRQCGLGAQASNFFLDTTPMLDLDDYHDSGGTHTC